MCRRAVTLIELIFLLMLLLCIINGSLLTDLYLPHSEHHWVNLLMGAIYGFSTFLVLLLAYAFLLDAAVGGIPRLPNCAAGTCRGHNAYTPVAPNTYTCKHGQTYRRKGRQFLLVAPSGGESPHLIWRPFRGWRKDSPST